MEEVHREGYVERVRNFHVPSECATLPKFHVFPGFFEPSPSEFLGKLHYIVMIN